MKTIEEHNRLVLDSINRNKQNANKTGVKCPKCVEEVELLNTCPGMVFMSNPPKIEVYCPACSYTGYLFVEG